MPNALRSCARAAVAGIGIVGLAVIIVIGGSRVLFGLFGQPYMPWDAAPDSLRHRAYDAVFVEHRWLTAAAFAAYGVIAAVTYRGEIVKRLGGPRAAWLGVLGLLALVAALAAWLSGA